jgi:hypothetical protein
MDQNLLRDARLKIKALAGPDKYLAARLSVMLRKLVVEAENSARTLKKIEEHLSALECQE